MAQPTDDRPADGPSSPPDPALANGSAIGAAYFPGLPNPVALHLLQLPRMTGGTLWLYALYEEEGIEFDAAARIDPNGEAGRMAELLTRLMTSEQCISMVVDPLVARVAEYFKR